MPHSLRVFPDKKIIFRAAWLVALGSACTMLPSLHPLLEINKNLGSYYLVAHFLLLLFLLLAFRKERQLRRLTLLVTFGFFLVQLYPLLPLLLPHRSNYVCKECPKLKLLYANLFAHNETPDRVRAIVDRESPDVVGVLELTPKLQRVLNLASQYPYAKELPSDGCFGLALYSKYPFVGEPITDVGDGLPHVVIADLQLEENRVASLVVFHSLPPLSSYAMQVNKLLVRRIATILKHSAKEAIVIADMNATPYSNSYRLLAGSGKFRSVFEGELLPRTWNVFNPLMRLTIDHMLYRGGMIKDRVEVLDAVGSDHFPILAEFSLLPLSHSRWHQDARARASLDEDPPDVPSP